jgi:hypothetical protein
MKPLLLAICWSLVGCNRDPIPIAPPCPSSQLVEAPSPGTPPFASISSADRPAHVPVTWRLTLSGFGLDAGFKAFEVGSKRAADVPIPKDFGWTCRIAPEGVLLGQSGMTVDREVRCSSDHWRTSVGDTGDVSPGEAPEAADVALYNGGDFVGGVTLQPCIPRMKCAAAPEMP